MTHFLRSLLYFQEGLPFIFNLENLICRGGDFIADDKYLFEIGGRSKSQHQIQEYRNGFIVKDDDFPLG